MDQIDLELKNWMDDIANSEKKMKENWKESKAYLARPLECLHDSRRVWLYRWPGG